MTRNRSFFDKRFLILTLKESMTICMIPPQWGGYKTIPKINWTVLPVRWKCSGRRSYSYNIIVVREVRSIWEIKKATVKRGFVGPTHFIIIAKSHIYRKKSRAVAKSHAPSQKVKPPPKMITKSQPAIIRTASSGATLFSVIRSSQVKLWGYATAWRSSGP